MAARKKVAKVASPGTPQITHSEPEEALPRKHASGAELTTELCNLEMRLRKRKADLEKAEAGLELAKGAVKTAEGEVTEVQDAIADALYDLRQGQGRITFPDGGEAA